MNTVLPKGRSFTVNNQGVGIHVDVYGEPTNGEVSSLPSILCVHGWPEQSYSWRHQVKCFVELGYTVATMDVRGYGKSDKPVDIEGYTLASLSQDVACVAEAISRDPVVLFGHDWGAPICYATALRHPGQIRAVAGLSVPFSPYGEVALIDVLKSIYAEQFFYILYFQNAELVEAEVEADMSTALRKIYYALCGDAPENEWLKKKPADAGLLDDLVVPDSFPEWMTDDDFDVYVNAFTEGGFSGPIARYRAVKFDEDLNVSFHHQLIKQPACFIAGSRDAVRNYIPGVDGFADPSTGFDDYRGTTIIEGKGHWIQQEAPEATNTALKAFMGSLAS